MIDLLGVHVYWWDVYMLEMSGCGINCFKFCKIHIWKFSYLWCSHS